MLSAAFYKSRLKSSCQKTRNYRSCVTSVNHLSNPSVFSIKIDLSQRVDYSQYSKLCSHSENLSFLSVAPSGFAELYNLCTAKYIVDVVAMISSPMIVKLSREV